MIRQRITIHNPSASHDGLITHMDKSSFQLNAPPEGFYVEKRIIVPKSHPFPLIELLRVQVKANEAVDGNPLFNFPTTQGTAFYVEPSSEYTSDQQKDLIEQSQALVEQFTHSINGTQWIGALKTIYLYNETVDPELMQNIDRITPGTKLLVDDFSILDIFVSKGGMVLKQVYHTNEPLSFETDPAISTEVGLFLVDPAVSTPDDLVLSGLRVLLNQDEDEENYHKTMFHFKPRHRHLDDFPVESTITENGLHPILSTKFKNGIPKPSDDDIQECKLYYHLNLARSLIFDKYQSVPEGARLVVQNGKTELEAPVYKVHEWGNEILFEFDDFNSSSIDFTLHSRYQAPDQSESITIASNPKPEVFVACSISEDHLLDYSPLDNKAPIGGNYELYFTNDTVFYHFPHLNEGLIDVKVPHGTSDFALVNTITTIAVAAGLYIVLASLLKSALGRGKITKEKKDQ
ncbi:PIG-X-domain-containing protein [Suhomyces tanzawaensis NRRL Y-17324]|uniref:Protein PBN1 n=1 Tax=Suhomyces tanzawaensis NRRL Y-17324 TaxID=984487 RepID=A0A1E4SQS7_9ASCO|nr:PIG-X-domain-containing protein [Suhomyces tanzawaensis NRRL Y-17324]ODV81848.1 PIG-X-domain-containing protein [Suhomyces tanzawaensis NRRL Y-17324]